MWICSYSRMPRDVEQAAVDRARAFVVQLGVGDGGAVDLGLEQVQLHVYGSGRGRAGASDRKSSSAWRSATSPRRRIDTAGGTVQIASRRRSGANSRLSIRRVRPSRAAISATRGPGLAVCRLGQVRRADDGVVDARSRPPPAPPRASRLDRRRAACRPSDGIAHAPAGVRWIGRRDAARSLGGQVLVARTHRQAVGLAQRRRRRRSSIGNARSRTM